MQIKRLMQCPVCGSRYMEGTQGGCPMCGGGKRGVVRPLTGPEAPAPEDIGPPSVHTPSSALPPLWHGHSHAEGGPAGQTPEPVRGWLVCAQGARRGEYYRLIDEKNLISDEQRGRVTVGVHNPAAPDRSPEVRTGGVSGMLIFDGEKNEFWLLNGCGRNVIRVNGKVLINAVKLEKGDSLKIGKTTELVFIPARPELPDKWI